MPWDFRLLQGSRLPDGMGVPGKTCHVDHSDEAIYILVLLWDLRGKCQWSALPEESRGAGQRLPWALWEHFSRAAFVYLSGEMLNISQVPHPLWNILNTFMAWIWVFICDWSSIILRSHSRLWLNFVNCKTSHLGLEFGAACLKGWSLAPVSEEHIRTFLRNAVVSLA